MKSLHMKLKRYAEFGDLIPNVLWWEVHEQINLGGMFFHLTDAIDDALKQMRNEGKL